DYGSNENSKFTNLTPISPINQPIQNNSQSFYNPFTMDISADNLNISSGNQLHESTYNGPKINSFQTLTNYNTAPRGWDQGQTFYRPVTFDKPLEPIAYSDF
ncbi:hypothetical protein PV327_011179, partial [Microctonus hyperodae]